jgi:hypothetical protein
VIGEVSKGEGFAGCVGYASSGGEYLDGNVAGRTPQEIAREMREVVSQRPSGCADPVRHFMMRPAPGEDLSEEQWRRAASLLVGRMGYAESPWAAYLHSHGDGRHLHVVTSLVRYDGKLVKDSFEKRRIHDVARVLEQEFGLQPVKSQGDRGRGDCLATRTGSERSDLAELRATIDRALETAQGRSLGDLAALLRSAGVEMRVRTSREQLPVGVSFRAGDGPALPGGELGKSYTVGALERRLGPSEKPRTGWVGCSGLTRPEAQMALRGYEPDAVLPLSDAPLDLTSALAQRVDLRQATFVWKLPEHYAGGFVSFLQRELPGRSIGPVEGLGAAHPEPSLEVSRYRSELGALADRTAGEKEAVVHRLLGRAGRALEELGKARQELLEDVPGAAQRLALAAVRVYRETGWRDIPPRLRPAQVENAVRSNLDRLVATPGLTEIVVPRELRGAALATARGEYLRGVARIDRARSWTGFSAISTEARGVARAGERLASGQMRAGDLALLGGGGAHIRVRAADAALRAPRRRELRTASLERVAARAGEAQRPGGARRVRSAGERAAAVREERRAAAELLRDRRRGRSRPDIARRILVARAARADGLCRWAGVPSLGACIVAPLGVRRAVTNAALAEGVDSFTRSALRAGLSAPAVVRAVSDTWSLLVTAGVVTVSVRVAIRLAIGAVRQYAAASREAEQEHER